MTRTEEVDAAIERAKSEPDPPEDGAFGVMDEWMSDIIEDRVLLADEVVLLREAVRGLHRDAEKLHEVIGGLQGVIEDEENEIRYLREQIEGATR